MQGTAIGAVHDLLANEEAAAATADAGRPAGRDRPVGHDGRIDQAGSPWPHRRGAAGRGCGPRSMARSATAEAAPRASWMALLSRVRHCPSGHCTLVSLISRGSSRMRLLNDSTRHAACTTLPLVAPAFIAPSTPSRRPSTCGSSGQDAAADATANVIVHALWRWSGAEAVEPDVVGVGPPRADVGNGHADETDQGGHGVRQHKNVQASHDRHVTRFENLHHHRRRRAGPSSYVAVVESHDLGEISLIYGSNGRRDATRLLGSPSSPSSAGQPHAARRRAGRRHLVHRKADARPPARDRLHPPARPGAPALAVRSNRLRARSDLRRRRRTPLGQLLDSLAELVSALR